MDETGAILKDVSARKYSNLHYDRLRKARKELIWALSEVRVKKSDVNSIEELLSIIWAFFADTSNRSTRLRLHIQVEHAMQAYKSLKEQLSRYNERRSDKMQKGLLNSHTRKTNVAEENRGKEKAQRQEGKPAEVKRKKHVNFSDTLCVSPIISTYLPLLKSGHNSKYPTDLNSGKPRIDEKHDYHVDDAGKENNEKTSPANTASTPLSSLDDSTIFNLVSSEKRTTNSSGTQLEEPDEEVITDNLETNSAKRLANNDEESSVHSDKITRLTKIRPEALNLKKEFSQLYQSHWMDAFAEMSEKLNSEEEIIAKLLNIVMYSFQFCEKTAKRQMKNIETDFEREILFPNDSKVFRQNNESMYSFDFRAKATVTLRRLRQEVAHTSLPALIPMVVRHIEKNIISPVNQDSRLYHYIEQCVDLTWSMSVQNPPMDLYKCESGTAHQNKFRSYTRSGPIVRYCVWPCLYLHTGGPLLEEGIAQME